jgi:predicted transcriptional regulator
LSDQTSNRTLLESVARESALSMDEVLSLYEREYSALAESARITNYVPLLALQRVRHHLLRSPASSPN